MRTITNFKFFQFASWTCLVVSFFSAQAALAQKESHEDDTTILAEEGGNGGSNNGPTFEGVSIPVYLDRGITLASLDAAQKTCLLSGRKEPHLEPLIGQVARQFYKLTNGDKLKDHSQVDERANSYSGSPSMQDLGENSLGFWLGASGVSNGNPKKVFHHLKRKGVEESLDGIVKDGARVFKVPGPEYVRIATFQVQREYANANPQLTVKAIEDKLAASLNEIPKELHDLEIVPLMGGVYGNMRALEMKLLSDGKLELNFRDRRDWRRHSKESAVSSYYELSEFPRVTAEKIVREGNQWYSNGHFNKDRIIVKGLKISLPKGMKDVMMAEPVLASYQKALDPRVVNSIPKVQIPVGDYVECLRNEIQRGQIK